MTNKTIIDFQFEYSSCLLFWESKGTYFLKNICIIYRNKTLLKKILLTLRPGTKKYCCVIGDIYICRFFFSSCEIFRLLQNIHFTFVVCSSQATSVVQKIRIQFRHLPTKLVDVQVRRENVRINVVALCELRLTYAVEWIVINLQTLSWKWQR